jgi:hypothetical protein
LPCPCFSRLNLTSSSPPTSPPGQTAGCTTIRVDAQTVLVIEPARTADGQPAIHFWTAVEYGEQAGLTVPAALFGQITQATLAAYMAATRPPTAPE